MHRERRPQTRKMRKITVFPICGHTTGAQFRILSIPYVARSTRCMRISRYRSISSAFTRKVLQKVRFYGHFRVFSSKYTPSPPGSPGSGTRWIRVPIPVMGSHRPKDLPEPAPGHLTHHTYSTTAHAPNVTRLNIFIKHRRHFGITRPSHTCRRHLWHPNHPHGDAL
jgi:hypothetical protein